MTGVRWSRGGGLEGKCDACCQWWPLDEDFLVYWLPPRGLKSCRACNREATRQRLAGSYPKWRESPEYVARRRAYQREYMRTRRALLGRGRTKAA